MPTSSSVRLVLVLAFSAFIPFSGLSQKEGTDVSPSCPVQITGINPTGDDSFSHAFTHNTGHARDNDSRMFVLKAKNTSRKGIKGMKFQAAYFNAIEDITDLPTARN